MAKMPASKPPKSGKHPNAPTKFMHGSGAKVSGGGKKGC